MCTKLLVLVSHLSFVIHSCLGSNLRGSSSGFWSGGSATCPTSKNYAASKLIVPRKGVFFFSVSRVVEVGAPNTKQSFRRDESMPKVIIRSHEGTRCGVVRNQCANVETPHGAGSKSH